MTAPSPQPGICRYCRCTETTPCSTPPSGEPCGWLDQERTVCSAPGCMRAYHADKAKRDRQEYLNLCRNVGIHRGSRKRRKKGAA